MQCVLHLFHWQQQSVCETGTCSVYRLHCQVTGWTVSTLHYFSSKPQFYSSADQQQVSRHGWGRTANILG